MAAKKKRSKRKGTSAAQLLAAATRALAALQKFPKPRSKTAEKKQQKLELKARRALAKSGKKPREIASAIGWAKRKKTSKPVAKKARASGAVKVRSAKRKRQESAQRSARTRAILRFERYTRPRGKREEELAIRYRKQLSDLLKRQGHSPHSIRSIIGAITRRYRRRLDDLAQARARILAVPLDATRRNDWRTLKAHLENKSRKYQQFLQEALDLGFSVSEANDSWFSPEAEE